MGYCEPKASSSMLITKVGMRNKLLAEVHI